MGIWRSAEEIGLEPGEFDESGGDFLVLHASAPDDVKWVLRAPRRPSVAARVPVEGALLDLIADRLPVAVPRWTVRTPDFVAYERLPGAAADPLPQRYFDDVGRFLAALHAVPVDEVAATGLEIRSAAAIRETIARKVHRARAELGISTALWEHWQRWLADDSTWPPRSVLAHADVIPSHTLVADGRVVGLLDWSDALVGDPAADFRRLRKAFGPSALDELIASYERHGGQVWPGMRAHVEERVRMGPVDSGLYGIDSGQERHVAAAREQLRAMA
ncbi:phosphotransferase [Lentzea tibetensis]|uniref:Phosphotransferase n=1 Tax=Lentzea tibetensis TaxID=2591470 RepID=A0A563EIK8_9PSEU|nr:macrolide 2'-phosphotransferase [Lentzea tibetensis]TWP46524.1 phosphotransferase [Lentzea tibetensis]